MPVKVWRGRGGRVTPQPSVDVILCIFLGGRGGAPRCFLNSAFVASGILYLVFSSFIPLKIT